MPLEPSVVEDGDDGTPMVLSHPESSSSKSFRLIVDEVLKYPGIVRKSESS